MVKEYHPGKISSGNEEDPRMIEQKHERGKGEVDCDLKGEMKGWRRRSEEQGKKKDGVVDEFDDEEEAGGSF
jgi:hypothetical protein